MPVTDEDMPQAFQAANDASIRGQNAFLAATRGRLACLVLAAATGALSWRVSEDSPDLLGLLGAALFVVALLIELSLWRNHPERQWYDGRALAESVKTIAWKFACAGQPFPVSENDRSAERNLLEVIDELRGRYQGLALVAMVGSNITDWMHTTRALDLETRKSLYIDERIVEQQRWYSKKEKYNRQRARQWRWVLLVAECSGVAAGVIEAITTGPTHLGPVFAALTVAVVAWLETKQHDQVARAYGTTVSDLASARGKLQAVTGEDEWAQEMNDAEDAISREHTLWLASRSRR